MKVFEKKNCLFVGILLLVFMIVGSFFDFQISTALFDPDSLFGMLFASYGQLPAMLCISTAGTLLIKIADHQKKVLLILSYLFGILLNAFAILGITMDPMLYIPHMSIVLSLIIAVILVGVVNFIMLKLTQDANRQQIKKVIILFIGVMFLEMIIINIIKIPWARPRMRMITAQNQVFQPWWVIGSDMKDHFTALDKRYIRMAQIWAENSYCQRRKVGALIVKDKMIISDGYNGTPAGFENCCEDENGHTYPFVLHAEANAITKVARSNNSSDGATLYVTSSPCIECSKLIIQAGISRVVFSEYYRLQDGIELLQKAGIQVDFIDPQADESIK